MRLLILSDLHIELWRDGGPKIDLAESRPDVVVLAGDIHADIKGIAWAAEVFDGIPTVYVSGNHEAYGGKLEEVKKDIFEACKATTNIHYLNQSEWVIEDIRFLGATLWTDFRLFSDEPADRHIAMSESEKTLNDYKLIRLSKQGYRKLRASDTARLHAQHRSWLTAKLAEPFSGKTVVVTHMAPSMLSVAPQYADDPVSAAFASRLDHLVGQADLWIHGHMHDSFDYTIGKCRVVCNPRGYRNRSSDPENQKFDPNFFVDLTS